MIFKLDFRFYFVIFILITFKTYAQTNVGIGGSIVYNLQTQGIGAELRAQIKLFQNLSVVPQVYYFPSFNKIHEYFIGANLHYEVYRWSRITPYVAAGGFYNNWINSETSGSIKAKTNNILPEGGIGILFGKNCLKPFVEQRYNPVWREGCFRIGFIYYPGCNTKGKGINKRTYACPEYQK